MEDTDTNLLVQENAELKRTDTNFTQYYSANSEPVVVEVAQNKNIKSDQDSSCEIKLKKKRDPDISEVAYCDSFESVRREEINHFFNDSEYDQLREAIKNKEFEKVREIERKIVQKEIGNRNLENNKRLQKLKRLEEKLASEVKPMLNDSYNPSNQNLIRVHPNFPNKQPFESKVRLNLLNRNKGEGYSIVTQEEVDLNFDEHKFCDYFFYTKK